MKIITTIITTITTTTIITMTTTTTIMKAPILGAYFIQMSVWQTNGSYSIGTWVSLTKVSALVTKL